MKHLIVLAVLLLSIVPGHSTCIVIYRTSKDFYVGADSRRTIDKYINNRKVDEWVVDTHCKIHKVGRFYFAISGALDGEQFFKAQQACLNATNLNEIATRFSSSMKAEFMKKLEPIRRGDPATYKVRYVDNSLSRISFFAFENASPQIVTLIFNAKNKPTEPLSIVVTKHLNEKLTFLGANKVLNHPPPDVLDRLSTTLNSDPARGVRDIVAYAMTKYPKAIGGPVDILHLNASGAKWIYKKKDCSN